MDLRRLRRGRTPLVKALSLLAIALGFAAAMLSLQALIVRLLGPYAALGVGILVALIVGSAIFVASADNPTADRVSIAAFLTGLLFFFSGYLLGASTWEQQSTESPKSWRGWVDLGMLISAPIYRWLGLSLIVLGLAGWLAL